MTEPSVLVDNLRERIEESDAIDDADRAVLRQFDDALTLLNSDYSDYRHAKLLRHNIIMAEDLEGGLLAAALEDKDAAEQIVRWIHRNYSNEETNQDYRVAVKVLGRRVTEDGVNGDPDEPPRSLAWIPSGKSNNYDPAPEPGQMLNWEQDIIPMLEATTNARDEALIALQFDAGLRGFELHNLTVGDITDHRHGLQVTVNGKQGRRTVAPLIPSVSYVEEWLAVHPAREESGDPQSSIDQTAPLWTKLNAPEQLSYGMLGKAFKGPAKRADIDKPVNPTNFRKSSASWYASKGLSQSHLENRYGWTRGSKAASRYVTIFGTDASDAVARLHGLEVEETEDRTIGRVVCPRCEEENKHTNRFCARCGQALTADAIDQFEQAEERLKESYAETDPRDTEALGEIESLEAVMDHPEVKQAVADAIADVVGD